MEPLGVLLILVVLAVAAGLAGHSIARSLRPVRRELWRRRIEAIEQEAEQLRHEQAREWGGADPYQINLERLEAERADNEVRPFHAAAAGDPGPAQARAGHPVLPGDRIRDDTVPDLSLPELRRHRRAGEAPEDLDY